MDGTGSEHPADGDMVAWRGGVDNGIACLSVLSVGSNVELFLAGRSIAPPPPVVVKVGIASCAVVV